MPEPKQTEIRATPDRPEIVITRVFDAPRELVFRAFTDPNLIRQWWGPSRYTTTVDHMEVKPGGRWRFIHRDLEGNEYCFNGVFREITPPERIVQTFELEGMPGHVSVDTGTFQELPDGKTRLTATSTFDSFEDRDGMLQSGMEEGMSESYDRLNALLVNERVTSDE